MWVIETWEMHGSNSCQTCFHGVGESCGVDEVQVQHSSNFQKGSWGLFGHLWWLIKCRLLDRSLVVATISTA